MIHILISLMSMVSMLADCFDNKSATHQDVRSPISLMSMVSTSAECFDTKTSKHQNSSSQFSQMSMDAKISYYLHKDIS
jgi:hypothetical protein